MSEHFLSRYDIDCTPEVKGKWFSAWALFRMGWQKSVQIIFSGTDVQHMSHPNPTCPLSTTTRPSTKRSTQRFRLSPKGQYQQTRKQEHKLIRKTNTVYRK